MSGFHVQVAEHPRWCSRDRVRIDVLHHRGHVQRRGDDGEHEGDEAQREEDDTALAKGHGWWLKVSVVDE
jgi:hypothetical protein